MNERIQQLAEQAETYANEQNDKYGVSYNQTFKQKYAELIIQECMRTIKQNENASLNIGNFTDEKKQGIQLGLEFAITDIAEHFGVEE